MRVGVAVIVGVAVTVNVGEGVSVGVGVSGIPTPESLILWGPPWALSPIVRIPLRVLSAFGPNATEIVQLAFGTSTRAHSLASAKSPVIDTVLTEIGIVPAFAIVTGLGGLVVLKP